MQSATYTVISVVLLLTANAFFVAAEFALVKARPFRIEALAEAGRFGARLTQRIMGNLEAYLAACQLGITMASLGLGWVGEPAVAAVLEPAFRSAGMSEQLLHTVSFLIGFVVFSSLHIVVGEQVPKTFAIRKAAPVSLWAAYPLRAFFLMVYPLNWALNRASGSILSLFNVAEASHADLISDEELRGIIDKSREHGTLHKQRAQIMSNLFAFDERTVGRVMIPRGDVTVLDMQASPEENLRVLRESGHSRFPLVDGSPSEFVGVLLAKKLYDALLDDPQSAWTRLREFCIEAVVVPETLRIGKLFETMRQRQAHMALVVDEYGSLVGLATLEDLIEEIVGDIEDELDVVGSRYDLVETTDGWETHGLSPLADVERITGLVVPPDLDANTLSGLFIQRLGRMPRTGDVLSEEDLELEVLAMKAHRVERVAIRRTQGRTTTTD